MRRRRSSASPIDIRSHVYLGRTPVVRVRSSLSLLEDRRLYHPAYDLRPVRSFFTKPRLVISRPKGTKRNGAQLVSHNIAFDVPKRVAICIRRKQRKEVIHAKRLTHKGSGGAKHRNWWSDVQC